MKKVLTIALLCLLASSFAGCKKESNRPATVTTRTANESDTGINPVNLDNKDLSEDPVPEALPPEKDINIETVPINTSRNSVAQFLAGNKQGTRNEITKYEDSSAWKTYSKQMKSKWKSLEAGRLKPYETFRDKELSEINSRTKILFYPFGGPDVLHAVTFFPDAEMLVLIGLEKVGSLPGVQNMEGDSAMIKYFNNMKSSINTVLSISFFITKDMKVDFKAKELDGILPILLVFAVRTGHDVADIKGARIDANGEIVSFATDQFQKTTGVEITLKDQGGKFKKLYYFSKNLADGSLKPNSPFYQFIKKMGTVTTYLKAASYLMHNDAEFANIRSLILAQSRYVVQDDSGIPMKFFNQSKWDLTFYGHYDKPINMFQSRQQPDLAQVYKDSSGVRKLGFGIGYQHNKGRSNMMVAKRK